MLYQAELHSADNAQAIAKSAFPSNIGTFGLCRSLGGFVAIRVSVPRTPTTQHPLRNAKLHPIWSNHVLMSIIKYGFMLSCQDPSPFSSANPLPADSALKIRLPDNSMKSHQAFDIE